MCNLLTRSLLVLAFSIASVAPGLSQEIPQPPDFSDSAVLTAAEDTAKAWGAWQRGERNMEADIYKGPMGEARERIQRSLFNFLAYTAKRRAYSEKVAKYIESSGAEIATRRPRVTIDVVNRDQLELLGSSLSGLQDRLDGLRESPDWVRIRRAIQSDRGEIMAVQSARRAEIPVELPMSRSSPARPLSVIVYRESERQVIELMERIWTHYYQVLVDAAEQRSGTGKPLLTSGSDPAGGAETSPVSATPAGASGTHPMAGVWNYVERSQNFNGFGEPTKVLLELWVEKGLLAGRYRAILSGPDGPVPFDLKLQQLPPGVKPSKEVRFRYSSQDEQSSGQLGIESSIADGGELMVVHMAGSGLPKGRETVVRR